MDVLSFSLSSSILLEMLYIRFTLFTIYMYLLELSTRMIIQRLMLFICFHMSTGDGREREIKSTSI